MKSMGKPNAGVPSSLHSIVMTLALFLVLTVTSPVMATPPARRDHYVKWEGFKQLSIQFFAEEAQQFIQKMEGALEPALPGTQRQHLKRDSSLYDGMLALVTPLLISQQAPKVKTYFQKVNEGRWIEGKLFSSHFSGNTFVRIQLTSRAKQEYEVNFEDWATGKKDKAPVFTMLLPTKIRILPIYDKGDVFVFNNVNNLHILNTTWGKRYGPENPARFAIEKDLLLHEIGTMHSPYKEGMPSGLISLKREDGSILGPWETELWPSFGGISYVAWACHPDIVLTPGTYEIVDSNPDSWQNNDQSDRRGMGWVIASPPK
jgi:hypothetical protein